MAHGERLDAERIPLLEQRRDLGRPGGPEAGRPRLTPASGIGAASEPVGPDVRLRRRQLLVEERVGAQAQVLVPLGSPAHRTGDGRRPDAHAVPATAAAKRLGRRRCVDGDEELGHRRSSFPATPTAKPGRPRSGARACRPAKVVDLLREDVLERIECHRTPFVDCTCPATRAESGKTEPARRCRREPRRVAARSFRSRLQAGEFQSSEATAARRIAGPCPVERHPV